MHADRAERVSAHLGVNDIISALADGWRDFAAEPAKGLFFGAIFAGGGLLIALLLSYYRSVWLILPMAIGFPLIAPFVAAGLYEISRRRSRGEPTPWREILSVVWRQSRREFGWMAFVVLFIFWVWMYQVRLMIALFMGLKGFSSLDGFLVALTQQDGRIFLVAGSISGALLSFVLFCTTVIAMPLLLDREADFITAMITSWRVVLENFLPMMVFAALIAALTFAALVPAFLGLLVVLPVLGHGTWHVYERAMKGAS